MKSITLTKEPQLEQTFRLLEACHGSIASIAFSSALSVNFSKRGIHYFNGSSGFISLIPFELQDCIVNVNPKTLLKLNSIGEELTINLNEDTQTLSFVVDRKVKIRCQNFNINQEALTKDYNSGTLLSDKTSELVKDLKALSPFYSKDFTRAALQGIYVEEDCLYAGNNFALIMMKAKKHLKVDKQFFHSSFLDLLLLFPEVKEIRQSDNLKVCFVDDKYSLSFFCVDSAVQPINIKEIFEKTDVYKGKQDVVTLTDDIKKNTRYLTSLVPSNELADTSLTLLEKEGNTVMEISVKSMDSIASVDFIDRKIETPRPISVEFTSFVNLIQSGLFSVFVVNDKMLIFIGETATALLLRRDK